METVEELTSAKNIAEHVTRMLCSFNEYPEFGKGGVPVEVAAEVFGKDKEWVRFGIIFGWLPIGYATQEGKKIDGNSMKEGKRINYYISPKKLWEETGFIWKG